MTESDEETGEIVSYWDYDNPRTVSCNVTAINPQNSLEQFGTQYAKKVFLKIECPDNVLHLSDQAGNLRRYDEQAYYYGTIDNPYVFDVSGLSTQVDVFGNLVCYVGYLEYRTTL